MCSRGHDWVNRDTITARRTALGKEGSHKEERRDESDQQSRKKEKNEAVTDLKAWVQHTVVLPQQHPTTSPRNLHRIALNRRRRRAPGPGR